MANNPNNKDNLKPFKKGECGNPSGRPKELKGIKELIEELGDENISLIVKKLNSEALNGNLKAIQEVLDRYYGKPTQYQETTLSGEVNIKPKEWIK